MAIRINRLKKVVAALESVDYRHFDLATWRSERECGTTACAVGWYCIKNPKCGLKIEYSRPSLESGRLHGWDSVMFHFGLTEGDAVSLFAAFSYSNPYARQPVIDRINKFIADCEKK